MVLSYSMDFSIFKDLIINGQPLIRLTVGDSQIVWEKHETPIDPPVDPPVDPQPPVTQELSSDNRIMPDKYNSTNYNLTVCKSGNNTMSILSGNTTYVPNNVYQIKINGLYLAVIGNEPTLVNNPNDVMNTRLYWVVDGNKLKSYYNNKYISFTIDYKLDEQFHQKIFYGNFLKLSDVGKDVYINRQSLGLFKDDNGVIQINGRGVIGGIYIEPKSTQQTFVGWQWCPSYGKLYNYGPLVQSDNYVCLLEDYNTTFSNIQFIKI